MLGDRFVQGRSKFSDHDPARTEPVPKIYIRVRFGHLAEGSIAQVDTGAAWSVLAPRLAEKLGVYGQLGQRVKLSTRFGVHEGHLIRLSVTLVADEGDDLETEGTFFVTRDWPSNVSFLGYSGLLANIRFAVDPQSNDFYFGDS